NVSFKYTIKIENLSNSGRIYRRFNMEDAVINFILMVFDDLKKVAGTQVAEIEMAEDTKEKAVNTMNRLLQEIRDLAKIKDYEKYMKAFNRINCYKVTFPEIVV
ncbi:MAG: hypothetical protein K6T16_03290, partial [Candidatus Pacearchaeota archaeon]|nr:hypothetical protein [Candidatus Pacearchaeota archaeon]